MSEIGTLYKGIRYSLIHLGPSKWGKELLDPLNTYLTRSYHGQGEA